MSVELYSEAMKCPDFGVARLFAVTDATTAQSKATQVYFRMRVAENSSISPAIMADADSKVAESPSIQMLLTAGR